MTIIADGPAAEATSTLEKHRADSLCRDERVQRNLRVVRVKEITAKLDLDAIGVITVSRRPDGRLVVLDGGHRIQALLDNGLGEWEVTCKVFDGLTLKQEAGLFRRLNNTSRVTSIEDLLKGIVEGDKESVAISKIMERNGLQIALQSGPGLVSCAAAMRKVYRGQNGPAALGFAINVAVASWGAHSDSVDGHLVTGLGAVYARYAEDVDRAALIRKLAKHQGGAPGLIGQALALKAMRPSTVGTAVARIVVDIYNRGRGRRSLPPL